MRENAAGGCEKNRGCGGGEGILVSSAHRKKGKERREEVQVAGSTLMGLMVGKRQYSVAKQQF